MIRRSIAVAAFGLLAACQQTSPTPDSADTTVAHAEKPGVDETATSEAASTSGEGVTGRRFAAWAGRWTGVEGMFLDVTPLGDGRYGLEMQSDLDTRGTYEGREDERTIRFERGGEQLTLRRATGDETGLKWLAGKQDCLMVREGEGYCRD